MDQAKLCEYCQSLEFFRPWVFSKSTIPEPGVRYLSLKLWSQLSAELKLIFHIFASRNICKISRSFLRHIDNKVWQYQLLATQQTYNFLDYLEQQQTTTFGCKWSAVAWKLAIRKAINAYENLRGSDWKATKFVIYWQFPAKGQKK